MKWGGSSSMSFKALTDKLNTAIAACEVVDLCMSKLLGRGAQLCDISYYIFPNGRECLVHRPTGLGYEFELRSEPGADGGVELRYVATPVCVKEDK
jgi:hypothetical protein